MLAMLLLVMAGCIPDPADDPGKDFDAEVITTLDTSPEFVTQTETRTEASNEQKPLSRPAR